MEIKSQDVTAAHRVPGRRDVHRPIIKLQNLTAKPQIMKKKIERQKNIHGMETNELRYKSKYFPHF